MAQQRMERRLAAVLAADVAGYSRLLGIDEEGTLAQLKAHRREFIDPKISEHRGRIVNTTGDGMLISATFDTLEAAKSEHVDPQSRDKDPADLGQPAALPSAPTPRPTD